MPVLALILKITGLFFLVSGTLTMLFQKPVLVKLHYSGISDTIGVVFVMIGLFIDSPGHFSQWLLLIVLLVLIGPVSSIAIAKGFFEKKRRK